MLLGGSLTGCYATRMAWHHNDLFNSRRPVSAVLADPSEPQKTRQQLALVGDIMRFAQAEGLHTDGAYTYFIATDEPAVSYLVQAAYPDRLEALTWWFPIIGDVPYRGYFNREERNAKAEELRTSGFDVHIGAAGAFSSLGWFEDPVFSSMLDRSQADLAHLFFHELTHRTYWVPSSTQFNENLAEYVGEELTVKYLRHKGDHDAVTRYEAKRADRQLFHQWLVKLRQELNQLYQNEAKLSLAALMAAKKALFARHQSPPLKPAFKVADYIGNTPWNNADVLAASLYAPDTKAFAEAHACMRQESVGSFLKALKAATRAAGEPFSALASLCRDFKLRALNDPSIYS